MNALDDAVAALAEELGKLAQAVAASDYRAVLAAVDHLHARLAVVEALARREVPQ
jgi:hypothetical protein